VRFLLPFGVVFYALRSLNFIEIARVEKKVLVLVALVCAVYLVTILLLGKWMGLRKQIMMLVANGSAICGASAIAISAPAIEADQDDVSIALIAVTIVGCIALFIVMPFIAALLEFNNKTYALFSGTVLQFTGFVRAAVSGSAMCLPVMTNAQASTFALFIKSTRYLGLLVSIPLFASCIRRKPVLPLSLWLFLGAGIIGSYLYWVNPSWFKNDLMPLVAPVYNISWCVAMAAIGMQADIRNILSGNGIRALLLAMAGFIAAVAVFLAGWYFLRRW
jgi:uncharacterized integral membrane protein (TIGR00698 family)